MKLLTREEVKGIDSSSKTIEKWDSFLKEAVWNLGYGKDLIDNMYPYDRGVPMKDGSFLPIPRSTGRLIYQMSWADKLCGILSGISSLSGSTTYMASLVAYLVTVWQDENIFREFFPEEDFTAFEQECEHWVYSNYPSFKAYLQNNYLSFSETQVWPVTKRLIKSFFANSDILLNSMASREYNKTPYHLNSEQKEAFTSSWDLCSLRWSSTGRSSSTQASNMSCLFIYYRPFADKYTAFPKGLIRGITENHADRLCKFSEVYTQDYLVVSQNPIDKLMCSTKQAFGSCISIAKQDSTCGTQSSPAYGLPSLFNSDSIFMVYLTPGKHKNMYWEEKEWMKAPENRDKEKAYKYLKMTCRALTYMGTPRLDISLGNDGLAKLKTNPELGPLYDRLKPDTPRLYVGRQYSAKGEDYVWQPMIEWLLAKQGISTSMSYIDEVDDLYTAVLRTGRSGMGSFLNNVSLILLRQGVLSSDTGVMLDRYGYTRGIYYDNVNWEWERIKADNQKIPRKNGRHVITVGSSRTGSCSVQSFSPSSGADMFKVMTGKQKYNYVNPNVSVCTHCGELIPASQSGGRKSPLYCPDCMEKLGITLCEHCNTYYSTKDPEEVKMHKEVNLRMLTNPNNWDKFPENNTCVTHLSKCVKKASGTPEYVLCAHCGKIEQRHTYYRYLPIVYTHFEGMEIAATLCSTCTGKAVMCDKCKRVLFLDTVADALILLPKRRVICPDCIDNIRIKQEKRQALKDVLENATVQDLTEPEENQDPHPVIDEIATIATAQDKKIGVLGTLIKDVGKQISSYLQAHPEESFPALKSQNPPLPEDDVQTVEETDHEIPLMF